MPFSNLTRTPAVTGDPALTDAEERLLDHLAAHAIDAEVAVKLGIPVRDVKDRTERLASKVGVTGRAELVAWRDMRTNPPPDLPGSTVDAPPGEIPLSPHTGRRVSRRAFLALGGAAVVGGVGATAFALSRGEDEPSRVSPLRTAAAEGKVAVASREDIQEALAAASATWEVAAISGDVPLNWKAGMVIAEPVGGGNAYRLVGNDEANEIWDYRTSDDSRLILAVGQKFAYALRFPEPERSGRNDWSTANPIDREDSVILELSTNTVLMATTGTVPVDWEDRANLRLHLRSVIGPASFQTGPIPGFSLNDIRAAWIGDGPLAYVPAFNRNAGTVEFWTLDSDGEREVVFTLPSTSGDQVNVRWSPGGLCYVSMEDGPGKPTTTILEAANGRMSLIGTVPGRDADLSPDRRMIAYTEHEAGPLGGQGLDAPTAGTLRNVVVKYTAGGPALRVRSADLSFGDRLNGTRWLPDSSGIVVQVGVDPSVDSEGRGYATLRMDGGLVPFAVPPKREQDAWYEASRNRGPLPSPWDGTLFALGHGEYVSPKGNVRLPYDESGPGHTDPWGDGSARVMRMAIGHGGHGGGGSATHALPYVEFYPFTGTQRLRVSGAGDCLNLRAAPRPDGDLLGCYPDGAIFTLEPQQIPGTTAFPPQEPALCTLWLGQSWFSVRSEDGRLGWASGSYLRWTG